MCVYLPDSARPEREFACTVIDFQGEALALEPSLALDGETLRQGAGLKLLFPGEAYGWGYDAVLDAIERLPSRTWRMRLTRGPVPVERREWARVATRTIVVVRSRGLVIPAHMLDRSDRGMRLIAGRAVRLDRGQRVDVEISEDDSVSQAEVMWRRMALTGLEFGLHW